jgi:hypothetical protein
VIQIINAKYGNKDVTEIVQKQVKDNSLHIYIGKDLFGDPMPNQHKKFKIKYVIDGNELEDEVSQEEIFSIGGTKELEGNKNYSIGIVTFSKRIDNYFIPLLDSIREHTDREILVAINGDYKVNFDEEYRQRVLSYLSQKENVFPIVYPTFRGLAKIWNSLVINSSNDYILILNDDIKINNHNFWDIVQKYIDLYQTSFMMNNGFSHFVVKRQILDQQGWFDERFLGIGWEDTEFRNRIYTNDTPKMNNFSSRGCVFDVCEKSDTIENQKVAWGKYSFFNCEIWKQNLKPEKQYPYEKFYWENKDNL